MCSTNFPMWTKGNKTNPTFTYGLIKKSNGSEILSDKVSYLKNGKSKSINGYDHVDSKTAGAFVWKGKGLLSFVKSKWRVELMDPSQQWAVICFSKTLFTPEGVDIISRQKTLSIETINAIKIQMAGDSLLSKHVASLKNLYAL